MKKFLLKSLLVFLCAFGLFGNHGRVFGDELDQELRMAEPLDGTRSAPKSATSGDVRRETERLTSELRGLPFKTPVKYKVIDRSQLKQILIKKVKEQFTDEELRGYNRSLAAIGLIPEGTDLLKVLLSLYGEQVAAFYEPAEPALYTFTGESWTSDLNKMLLSHELTHALQDQNYSLKTFPLDVKDNDDLALATSALVEGDATLLMTRYYAENADPTRMLGDLTSMLGQDTKQLLQSPPYLQEMLLFPYQEGNQFATALFMAGGTSALNEAFRHRPISTQQILHPEKFLHDRRDPQAVALTRIQSKDWQLIGNNVLGEFGIRCLLELSAGSFEAVRAAQGWNGDRYHVYERGKNGPTGLVWTTVWENADAAKEFEDAYKTFAEQRKATLKLNRSGSRVTIRQSTDAAFFALSESLVAR